MIHRRPVALAAAFLFTWSCSSTPQRPVSGAAKVEDSSAIATLQKEYEAAETAGDAEALAELWAPDGILMPPGAEPIEGVEAIEAYFEAQFRQVKADVSIDADEAVMSGNWGFDRGSYTVKLTMHDGSSVADEGKFIFLVARQPDGALKISRSIFNSNRATPEAVPSNH